MSWMLLTIWSILIVDRSQQHLTCVLVSSNIEHSFAEAKGTQQQQMKSVRHLDTMNVSVALFEVMRR